MRASHCTSPRRLRSPGEHVLELQGHGGVLVMDLLLRRLLELGCRMARPGEFSERAYLNGKMDIAQAEAVADLIDAGTAAAARAAVRSMQGEFSARIDELRRAAHGSAHSRRGGDRFSGRGDRFSRRPGHRDAARAGARRASSAIEAAARARRAAARGVHRRDRRQAERRKVQLAQPAGTATMSPSSPGARHHARCAAPACAPRRPAA